MKVRAIVVVNVVSIDRVQVSICRCRCVPGQIRRLHWLSEHNGCGDSGRILKVRRRPLRRHYLFRPSLLRGRQPWGGLPYALQRWLNGGRGDDRAYHILSIIYAPRPIPRRGRDYGPSLRKGHETP